LFKLSLKVILFMLKMFLKNASCYSKKRSSKIQSTHLIMVE
jgi:hypothetical protein